MRHLQNLSQIMHDFGTGEVADGHCGSSQTTNSSNSLEYSDKMEFNGNVQKTCTLTEENLSKFISSIHNLDNNSGFQSPDESGLYEQFNSSSSKSNAFPTDNSDSLSVASVSSCGNFSYSDDEALSSNSCDVPLSPRIYPHGITNPNYPGFQHFAHTLDCYPMNLPENEYFIDRNNNTEDDDPEILPVKNLSYYLQNHQTDSDDTKGFDKEESVEEALIVVTDKMTPPDIVSEHHTLSQIQPDLIQNLNDDKTDDSGSIVGDLGKEIAEKLDTKYNFEFYKHLSGCYMHTKTKDAKLSEAKDKPLMEDKQNLTAEREQEELDSPKKKEGNNVTDKFGILEIETKLPVLDFDNIERSLSDNQNEEKRIHHAEIRKRIQSGQEDNYFKNLMNKDKPGRKPSLYSRLQKGKNLQICFMNEVSDGDTESISSDSETCPKLSDRSMATRQILGQVVSSASNNDDNDFYTYQAKLQIEARMALAQAKDMAHLQMELEKQRTQCPITQIIQAAMYKATIQITESKRRFSRQILTGISLSQLQIIVNELNQQITKLNEKLVQILMERDELHMGQDSILVDIEDLTRYMAAKDQNCTKTVKNTSAELENELSVKNNNIPIKFLNLPSFTRPY